MRITTRMLALVRRLPSKRIGLSVVKLLGLILLIAIVADAQDRALGGSFLRLSSTALDALGVGCTTLSPTAASCTGGIYAGTSTFTGNVKVTGRPQFGSTNVTFDSTGKIPGIDSTYFTSLSGANLTTLNASNISSGTVPTARLGSGSASSANFLRGDQTWASSLGQTLLCATSGTTTSAAASNVATCAISGLTALDSLQVFITYSTVTQQTAASFLYNSTDSVNVTPINSAAAMAADRCFQDSYLIRNDQSATTTIMSLGTTGGGVVCGAGATVTALYGNSVTFTTAWTGSWTLTLRAGAVTAGGTFKYNWAVYKIAGQ